VAVTANQTQTIPDREELVIELAGYLFTPTEHGQPIILWNLIGQSDKRSLVVIWDRWFGLPFSERTKIIYEANEALREPVGVDIATATGLTVDEAIALGYLPYQIQTSPSGSDAVSHSKLRQAMIAEGAATTSTGLELRFATLEAAEAAYRRLQTQMPGPHWMLVKEVVRDS